MVFIKSAMITEPHIDDFVQNTDFIWEECSTGIRQISKLLMSIPSAQIMLARTYCVPILYAYWERYFVSTFGEYIRVITLCGLPTKEYIDEIVGLRSSAEFKKASRGLGKKRSIQLIKYLRQLDDSPLDFSADGKWIDPKSNVGRRVLIETFEVLGLQIRDVESRLDRGIQTIEDLRELRNDIAHGSVIRGMQQQKWDELLNGTVETMNVIQLYLYEQLAAQHPLKRY